MIHVGVFLITLSGLLFEIGLTRIYSASIWYHFTFVAVSVALLGWGLGGLVVHVTKQGIKIGPFHMRPAPPTIEKAGALCMLYALAIVGTLALVARFPFTMDR